MRTETCTIEGCCGAVEGRGYCKPHYTSWYRHGDPLEAERRRLHVEDVLWMYETGERLEGILRRSGWTREAVRQALASKGLSDVYARLSEAS